MEINILTQGERIKNLRKELNINQEELGGKKFSKNYISMFENNKRQINPINAAFLALRVNEIAKKKNKNIDIRASYFLKTEEDMAKDECKECLDTFKNDYELTTYQKLIKLNNAIEISYNFNLQSYYAEALFLKAIDCLNRELYYCSTTHFLEAINLFSQLRYEDKVIKCYKYIGIIFYNQGNVSGSLIYLNNAHNYLNKSIIDDSKTLEEIIYYKALCYIKLNQSEIAKNLIKRIDGKNIRFKEIYKLMKH